MSRLQTVAQETAEFMEQRIKAALGGDPATKDVTLGQITVLADLIAIEVFGLLIDPSDGEQRVRLYQNLCNRADGMVAQMVERVKAVEQGRAVH